MTKSTTRPSLLELISINNHPGPALAFDFAFSLFVLLPLQFFSYPTINSFPKYYKEIYNKNQFSLFLIMSYLSSTP